MDTQQENEARLQRRPPTAGATASGLLAIVIWSTTVAVSVSLTRRLGTFTAAFAIYFGGGLLSLLVLALRPGGIKSLRQLPRSYVLLCGTLFTAYMAFFYSALGFATDHTAAIVAGIINYLWPALTLAFSVPILKQRARWTLWPGMLLAFSGIALAGLSGRGTGPELWESLRGNTLPYACALVAAVLWGLYSNYSRKLGGEGASGVPLFLLASGLLLGLLRLTVQETATWSPAAFAELAFMIALPSALGYLLWDRAVRRGNLVWLAVASYFIPICSTLISSLYLKVDLGLGLLLGCVLVSAGAVVCKFSFPNSPADYAA